MYRNVPKLHYLHLPYLTESGIPCEWHWEHCSNERRPISDVYMFYNEFIIRNIFIILHIMNALFKSVNKSKLSKLLHYYRILNKEREQVIMHRINDR